MFREGVAECAPFPEFACENNIINSLFCVNKQNNDRDFVLDMSIRIEIVMYPKIRHVRKIVIYDNPQNDIPTKRI